MGVVLFLFNKLLISAPCPISSWDSKTFSCHFWIMKSSTGNLYVFLCIPFLSMSMMPNDYVSNGTA